MFDCYRLLIPCFGVSDLSNITKTVKWVKTHFYISTPKRVIAVIGPEDKYWAYGQLLDLYLRLTDKPMSRIQNGDRRFQHDIRKKLSAIYWLSIMGSRQLAEITLNGQKCIGINWINRSETMPHEAKQYTTQTSAFVLSNASSPLSENLELIPENCGAGFEKLALSSNRERKTFLTFTTPPYWLVCLVRTFPKPLV